MTTAQLTTAEKIDVVLNAPKEVRDRLTLLLAEGAGEQKEISKLIEAFAKFETAESSETSSEQTPVLVQNDLPETETFKRSFDGIELIESIGEGGFGEVWKANQILNENTQSSLETKRLIAVKILHDPKSRFRNEIKLLAECDHPNVVHLFGSGQVDGRSYLAMEYVPKGTVLKYCADEKLSLRSRLELFLKICDGVEHLHRKGIVHHDLKPSNILMSSSGHPRIADFGLSVQEANQPQSLLADISQLAARGTIEYASPEALDLTQSTDTRSDVYSLGQVLFEMLLGQTLGSIKNRWLAGEFAAQKLTHLPHHPSRLASLVSAGKDSMPQHPSDSIGAQLEGDLDAILLKAIRPQPSDRYDSVSEFAKDVQAYLSHDCVMARKPTPPLYKTRKFIRRRPVIAAFLATLGLAGVTLAFLSTQLFLSNKALDGANQEIAQRVDQLEEANRKEKAATAQALAGKKRIEAQASNLKSINSVLQAVFEGFNPQITGAGEGELRGELVRRMSKVADEIIDQRLGMDDDGTQMKKHLAETLNVFGNLDTSIELWQHIRLDVENRKGRHDQETLIAIFNLGRTQLRVDPEAALATMREVEKIAGEIYEADHPVFNEIDHILAEALSKTGRLREAASIYEELISRMEQADETVAGLYIDMLNSHGSLAIQMQDFEKAEDSLAKAVDIGRQFFAESHVLLLTIRQNLVVVRRRLGKTTTVIEDSREILRLFQSQMPEDSPQVIGAKHQLATYLANEETKAEAMTLLQEIIDSNGSLASRRQAEFERLTIGFLFPDDPAEKKNSLEAMEELLERVKTELGADHPVALLGQQKVQKYQKQFQTQQ